VARPLTAAVRIAVIDVASTTALSVEEEDDALVRVVLGAEVGRERGDHLDAHGFEAAEIRRHESHDGVAAGQAEHRAQRHDHVAAGEQGQRPAHGRDRYFHGEDLGHELLVRDQDLHENSPFW
jgi:hypothetical protein